MQGQIPTTQSIPLMPQQEPSPTGDGPYRKGVEPLAMQHDRTPGDPEDDFLVPAELAIGPVISAATNRSKRGWKKQTSQQKAQRIALGVLGAIFGGILGAIVAGVTREALLGFGLWFLGPLETAMLIAGGIAGALFGAIVLVGIALLVRRPQASWVGKHGLQRYTRGLLFGPKLEVLRFDVASSLKVQRIRQFVNGAYTGTSYDYVWRDPKGAIAFRIHGSYRDDGAIEPSEPVAFAMAAEASWSQHRIATFDQMMRAQGYAHFQCGRDWIRVGKGYLEIGAGGATERVVMSDLADIFFEQGVLVMKKKGAKEGLFRSQGVFRFPVAALDDFQVFLLVLEEQTGIKFR